MHTKAYSAIPVIFFILSIIYLPLHAEYVFLKNGEIKQGSIASDNSSSIILRGKNNKAEIINRSDIMRLLYTELYMGKVYVQKTDGKNEICYMVDEDRDTYTFRKELYKPEEFKLRRDEVLFMARGNPSGLKGEPQTDRIDLQWFPPYNPVKKYRVYLKGPDDKEFVMYDECRGTSNTLKNLKSNTKYVTYVAALDDSGDESLPSNKLTFTTKNIKPDRPVKLRYEKRNSEITRIKKGKNIKDKVTKRFVIWEPVTDIDGTIKCYNIFHTKNEKTEKIKTVTNTEFEIPEDISVYDLRITAVDDRNDESPESRIRHPRALKIGVQPLYFIPHGKLADMFEPGFGILGSVNFKNFFYQNFEWGLSGGAVQLNGKDSDKYESMTLIPVTLDIGYHFHFTESLSLMPYISAGYTYLDIKYISLFQDKNKTAYEPSARGGAALSAEFDYFNLSAGGDYGLIYEESGVKPFYEIFLKAGVLFDL